MGINEPSSPMHPQMKKALIWGKQKGESIGFTGTRKLDRVSKSRINDMRNWIERTVKNRFRIYHPDTVFSWHHGDCVGGDELFHTILNDELRLRNQVVIHPPTNETHRAFCKGRVIRVILPAKPYLIRNKEIVNSSKILLALPKDREREEKRSGTWATVRYARKQGVEVVLF